MKPIRPLPPKIVLASASPRRAEILRNAGFPFEVLPPSIDETPLPGEPAHEYVLRLAREKASPAAKILGETSHLEADPTPELALIVAADTTVAFEDKILG